MYIFCINQDNPSHVQSKMQVVKILFILISSLWSELVDLNNSLSLENSCWIIGGDMNKIIHYSEHSSVTWDHLTLDMIELKDVFTTIGVEDLRYYGPFHTWTNKRPDDSVTKKLDKAMVNDKWLTSLPYSTTTFAAPEFSDHSSCIVRLACPLPSSASKPFKFFNYLVKHPDFLSIIEASWDQAGGFSSNISSFYANQKFINNALKTLNKDNFSDIQKRVEETNLQLQTAQVIALDSPSHATFQSEKDLHEKWSFS